MVWDGESDFYNRMLQCKQKKKGSERSNLCNKLKSKSTEKDFQLMQEISEKMACCEDI